MSGELRRIKKSVETLRIDTVKDVQSQVFDTFTLEFDFILDGLQDERQQAIDKRQTHANHPWMRSNTFKERLMNSSKTRKG